ncbi:MAG: FtsH protease activity modulator HflK [Legionella sp.]
MGWNEPNNDKNPWGGSQPPDIDEILKRMHRRMKNLFYKGTNNAFANKPQTSSPRSSLALLFLFATLVVWCLAGFFIVDPAEQAAILRFGRYIETVGPGPHWIPPLISSKIVLNMDRVSDYSYSANMLTKDENLVSVAVAVKYRIGDLQDYLFNVSDPGESLQQATSSALRQVVGQTTLDQMITEGREAWGNSVQDSLVKILDSYKTGIVIINVSPQQARAPENVQDAFDDAIKAQEDEKRFKEQARAYEARVVPIAEGKAKRIEAEARAYAQQLVLRAQGETAEFLALLPAYNHSPQVTGERIYLDIMQQILGRTSKMIVDAKAGNIFYLPLDKLFTPLSPKPATPEAIKHETVTNFRTPMLYDEREITRPTERIGGAN